MTREKRRLAAILAADIVGYSRLMGRDESGTVRRMKAIREGYIEPTVERHGGRIVKLTGDGALVEFASAVDALSAAITIQQATADLANSEPGDDALVFRIGLHLGDLIVDDDDLYGDGVNVAARLEAQAPAGGILISSNVHDAVDGRLASQFDDVGALELKNIERPVKAYRVKWEADDWRPATRGESDQQAASVPAMALPAKPSIAVLPFQNMSGDPEQDYFADGMVEDIITALSRFRHLFVIARNSSFTYKGRAVNVKQVGDELGVRYVLEGSVRKAGGRVRITGQLIDCQTGAHLWAERYDRELLDIFELQDQITNQVAGAIEPELLKIESGRAAIASGRKLSAWDLVCQGRHHFHQVTSEGHKRARDLFRQAAALDPQLPDPYIWIARVDAGIVAFGLSDDAAADLAEGLEAAHMALSLDAKDPYAHYALAIVSHFSGHFDEARRAAESAIGLSSSFALGYFVLGMSNLHLGDATSAIEAFESGVRLNPYDPQNFVFIQFQSLAYLFADQEEKALRAAQRSLEIRPDWMPALETLAICLVTTGRVDEARRHVEKMRALRRPEGSVLDLFKQRNPTWGKRMETLLQQIG